ncbi:MAG TPA: hypothetical protein VK053_17395 [Jiangellaceae bacterium]|nr:hypothetical protein [Jiangellaceae bacterium]
MHAFSVVPHHSVQAQQSDQAQQSGALPKAAASTTEIDELGGQTAPGAHFVEFTAAAAPYAELAHVDGPPLPAGYSSSGTSSLAQA